MKTDDLTQIRLAINSAAADAAATNLVLMALVAQSPNKAQLLQDFSELTEDHRVRTMFSPRPEEFFQTLQTSIKIWKEAISMG